MQKLIASASEIPIIVIVKLSIIDLLKMHSTIAPSSAVVALVMRVEDNGENEVHSTRMVVLVSTT